jgi:predicted nucleotidyltransferase
VVTVENSKMSEGVAWNQGEVSEETRKLILEAGGMKYQMAVFDMLDDIARPKHVERKFRDDHLIRGLRNMLIDFQLSGQDDYAECVTLAIEGLGGQIKPD